MVDQRFIGVIINVGGSVATNLGTNLMKHGHNLRQESLASHDELNADSSVHSISSIASEKLGPRPKVWYLGMFLFVVGSLVTFASFGFAPQSLLAALGSCQFISNCFFGAVILKEKLTRKIIIGTAVILVGNVIVICFSPNKTETYTSADLISFYDFDYQLFLLGELLVLICVQLVYTAYEVRLNGDDLDAELSSLSGHSSLEPARPAPYPGTSLVMPLSYAMFSAAIGTQSALQAKCFSELLNSSVAAENQFTHPFTYFVVLVAFLCTGFWLYRMNRALALFDGLFIIPVLQVFWMFFAILGGGMYFGEFESLGPKKIVGFISGVCVVFAGVFILSPTLKDKEEQVREFLETDEDTPEPSEIVRMAYYDKTKTRLLNFGFDQPMVTKDRDLKKVADKMGRTYENAKYYGSKGIQQIPGVGRLRTFSHGALPGTPAVPLGTMNQRSPGRSGGRSSLPAATSNMTGQASKAARFKKFITRRETPSSKTARDIQHGSAV